MEDTKNEISAADLLSRSYQAYFELERIRRLLEFLERSLMGIHMEIKTETNEDISLLGDLALIESIKTFIDKVKTLLVVLDGDL